MKEALLWMIVRTLRLQSLASTQLDRLERFFAGFSLAAFSPEQRAILTAALYSARGNYDADGLFEWERRWFSEDLPDPPARILIGGAGTGREAKFLLDAGYEVLAFDPAPSFAKRGQLLSQPGLLAFCQAGYEDLVNTSGSDCLKETRVITDNSPYDAILFGWGSFTHIASNQARKRILSRCQMLCPDGPLLISFWMRGEDTARLRGRLWKLGFKLGGHFCTEQVREEILDGEDLSARSGYGYYFTLAEISELAKSSGYQLKRSPSGPYVGAVPHATLSLPKFKKS